MVKRSIVVSAVLFLSACSFNTNVYLDDDAAVSNDASTDNYVVEAQSIQEASTDSKLPHPPCVDRSGTYTATFSELNTSCGSHNITIDVITAGDQFTNWINEASYQVMLSR